MHKTSSYNGWSDAHILSDGDLQVVIVPTIGGRIISMKFCGQEFCRQNEDSLGKVSGVSGGDWLNWGGDFDWVGPQESWNSEGWPPPYNIDSAPWQVIDYTDSSIKLKSKSCDLGVSLQKDIYISEGQLKVVKTMTNCTGEPQTYGIWNITQVKTEGAVSIPLKEFDIENLKVFQNPPGNSVSTLVQSNIINVSDSSLIFDENRGNFKVGLISALGQIDYEINGMLMKKIIDPNINAKYPHDCNIEIYRDDKSGYTELEQLWEMETIIPGESCSAEQKFIFFKK